ncbi:hypothetical protein ATCVMN08101_491R [Acanthocystis turfacea Chlorella virus MN0810.1]|nr:hypothetical protein ATCVMN08101_491R [Acanthocystis turfacea Chlorella virus MN0810.1]
MKLNPEAGLFMWRADTALFDKTSLAWYMASGKFDKNSMSRWVLPMTKLKAQILRASIDNSIVFLPVGAASSEYAESLPGNFVVICCDTRVYALGVIVQGPCPCPVEYKITDLDSLLAVHILATSFTHDIRLPEVAVEESDALPANVFKMSGVVAEDIDIDIPDTIEAEYEKFVVFAHWFMGYISDLKDIITPVKALEDTRIRRLCVLQKCIKDKISLPIPPPREFAFTKMLKTHKKYAEMFGRLM